MAMRTRKDAIVMDIDQVILDYYSRLREYVNKKYEKKITGLSDTWGLKDWLQYDSDEEAMQIMVEFSESHEFGTLDAFPGADVILHELLREGNLLVCVTACGRSTITEALRRVNLFHRFGDIFEEVHFVDMSESKTENLLKLRDKYNVIAFVDDKPQNILDAYYESGYRNLILMKAPHNRAFRQDNEIDSIKYAFTWYECKQFIDEFSKGD